MPEEVQSSESGAFRRVQDTEGVRFEPIPAPEVTGQAYVEPDRAKTRREQELAAGAKRVAIVTEQLKNRPPRIISEAERRAEPQNVPVMRPGIAALDRLNTGLGPLMRRVGANVQPPQ